MRADDSEDSWERMTTSSSEDLGLPEPPKCVAASLFKQGANNTQQAGREQERGVASHCEPCGFDEVHKSFLSSVLSMQHTQLHVLRELKQAVEELKCQISQLKSKSQRSCIARRVGQRRGRSHIEILRASATSVQGVRKEVKRPSSYS
ncbi:unnamed protein product [Durusdinium trenchii]|uniref:Uncharacterized protein n=1 Tax=Durusdinium trenchii TaxID=1381693 RepID=A0ABP0NRW9_9DINO